MKNILAFVLFTLAIPLFASPLKVGDKAPNLVSHTLKGKAINLKELLKEKPVYLKFWATWCQYCQAEMPHLAELNKNHSDKIAIITVNVGINDSIDNINAYFNRNNLSLDTVFDTNGAITQNFGVLGTPYHILIEQSGKVALTSFLHSDKIDAYITALPEKE